MYFDVAHIQSVLANPFDNLEATSLVVHTIALYCPASTSDDRSLIPHFRVWLDALLFLWASPSPMTASDPRRDIVWVELQIVAMKAIEVILCVPVLNSHTACSSSSLYSHWTCSEGRDAESNPETTTSVLWQPFEHWVSAMVSIVEKDLHAVASELQRRDHRPKRDVLIRRLEALTEVLIRVIGIAETDGSLLLPMKLLQSVLLWQNVFRVAHHSEHAFFATGPHSPLSLSHVMLRGALTLLLDCWCRAVKTCLDLPPVQQLILDILRGGDVMRELTRLMCMNQAKNAVVTAVPVLTAYLCAMMSSLWWRDGPTKTFLGDPQNIGRMTTLLLLVGGCAASEHHSTSHQVSNHGLGRWLHVLQLEWAQLTMLAASSIHRHHSSQLTSGSGWKELPANVYGEVVGNYKLLMFVLDHRVEAMKLLLEGHSDSASNLAASGWHSTVQEDCTETIAFLRAHVSHFTHSVPSMVSSVKIAASHDDLCRLIEVCCVVITSELNCLPQPQPQSFWFAPTTSLHHLMVQLLSIHACIEIAVEDGRVCKLFVDVVHSSPQLNFGPSITCIRNSLHAYASPEVIASIDRNQSVRLLAMFSSTAMT